MTDERRLTFVADGSTSDLQAACAKAAEAIRVLGQEAAKQARAQLTAGERTVKSNQAVAESYGTAADAAKAAAQSATSSAARQTAAAEKTATASKKSADAAKASASEQEAAATATQTASEKTATVAEASATKQRKASTEAASAAKTSAAETEAAATRTAVAFGKSGSALTHMGRNTALVLGGAAALTADWGVKFESSLTKLHTQAGVTTKNMHALGAGILAMSPAVGQVPIKLSEGMYHVASSMDAVLPRAQKVRDELLILRAAAEGAAIGGSDLDSTTYALSSAMNALGLRGRDASKTMAEVNAAVGAGDMRMQDMTSAMSTGYIPAAENFGVSLQSINAALAYMTDRGTPAQLSATRLRMSLSLLGAPTKQAAKMLDALGMSSGDVRARTESMTLALRKAGLNTTTLAADLRKPDGLAVALIDLKTHLHESGLNAEASAALISRAFGGGRSGAAIMEMVQHTDILQKKYAQIGAGVRNFGADWTATQHTISFQVDQLKATVVDLGTKLGLALIPRLQEAINSLRDVYHWFEQNQAAARALAVVVGGVLTVAITAWFVSLGRKLVASTREVAGLVRGIASIPSVLERTIAGSTAASTAESAGGASTVLGRTGMLGGLRSGYGLPGSAVNPLVVAMEGGALGGGIGAAETTAASGLGGVTAAEEGAAAAGAGAIEGSIMQQLRGAVGGIVGGLAKGAGIAGIGYLGSQLAGQVVGGHTGHVVSSVGGDAAIGAGLGSLIGPEGTVAGAIVGGLAGLFQSIGHSASEQLASAAVKGMRPDIKAHFQPTIQNDAKALASARQNLSNLTEQRGAYTQPRASRSPYLDPSKMPAAAALEAARKRVVDLERRTGTDMEKALQAGWNRYAVPDAGHMLDQFEAKFKRATPGIRDAAARSMIEYAHSLEANGRLPKGATDALIKNLEASYPGLADYLRQFGESTNRTLARALADRQVETAVHEQIAHVMGSFQGFGDTLRTLGGNTQSQWRTTMAFLVSQTQHGTQHSREIASRELQQMVDVARRRGTDFASWMALGTGAAATSAATNLSGLVQAFGTAMSDIAGQTDAISRSFGLKAINYVVAQPRQIIADVKMGAQIAGALFADGGYVGSPGERGRDTVHAILGRGEAVVNGPQQGPVEIGLAVSHAFGAQPYDSLGALFRGERRKHFMASGGFAGGQVFTASVFGGRNDPSAFNSPTASGKTANDSLWGFAELSNPPSSLNFAALGHLPLGTVLGFTNPATHRSVRAPKVDVGAGGPGLGGHVRGVDLTWAVGQALGVNGLADILVTGLHGALAQAGMALPQVLAPKLTGPGGPLQGAANAALRHSARAASDYIAGQMAQMGAGGVGAGGSFTGPTPPGLGSFDGLTVAKWIVPELAYARAHGWPGHITSGYRPGYDPHTADGNSEHRGTIYPHGAVDFGGMHDPAGLANKLAFMRAAAGYTGPQLIPAQGFVDDGHMSGTGHAQGGWVGLAHGLAPRTGHSPSAATAGGAARNAKARIKQHISKKHRKAKPKKGKRQTPIERALAPFHRIPDVNNLPGNVDAIKTTINSLTDQAGLLGTIASNPNNAYVLDADMPFLTPTLLPHEDIHAGMTVVGAQRLYESLINGTTTTPLTDLQGQLLDWMGQQPDHELLNADMISILRSTFAQTGVAFTPGTTVPGAQITNMDAQIGQLGHQVAVERGAIKQINAAIAERKTRRTLVDQLAHQAAHRLANLNRDLDRLQSRSLHERLAAAEGSAAVNTRVYDAQTQRNYLSDLIAHERQTKHPDRAAIDGWEQRKRDLTAFIHAQHAPRSHGSESARIALARNTIREEKKPLGEDLRQLAGQTTRIGRGGMLGRIDNDVKTLRTGRGDMQSDIQSVLSSTLPSAKLGLIALQQSLPESERPVLPAGDATSADNTALTDLLRQQNQQLAQALAVSQSQFAIFNNFRAFMPAYEHGGLVKNTGLALVHQGEWITPNPRGPYGSQIASNSASQHTNVHLHLHGETAELLKLVDARVDSRAPHTVSVVQGQRSRALGAAPGGKSKRAY